MKPGSGSRSKAWDFQEVGPRCGLIVWEGLGFRLSARVRPGIEDCAWN